MENKKILVTRSSLPPFEEFTEMIRPIWDSAWLTNMGEFHDRLQRELTDYLGVEKLVLFTNGHMALEMALQALQLPAGSEVITTPFTFASTVHAITRNGLRPVLCDIREDDYTIDADKIEALITERTRAIVPVHVYGHVCEVDKIQAIADRYRLSVIYDAAHAFGETYRGIGIGNYGDASMFSFHATKVFHSIEGGAVAFHSDKLRVLLNYLKNYGITGPETVEHVGGNAKMSEFQAAMGLCNLRHIGEELGKRKLVVECYRSLLGGVPGMRVSYPQKDLTENYIYFPVIFEGGKKRRDAVYEKLAAHNIFARKYFYPLVSDYACYAGQFDTANYPVAARMANGVLTLPCYADLPLAEVERICDIIRGV